MDIVIYELVLLASIVFLVLAYYKAAIFSLFAILYNVITMSLIISDNGVTQQVNVYNSTSNSVQTFTVSYIPAQLALLPLIFLTIISFFALLSALRRR